VSARDGYHGRELTTFKPAPTVWTRPAPILLFG
jgi:hypothetical protein